MAQPQPPDASQVIAAHLASCPYDALAAVDIEATRRLVLDTLGCLLGGSAEPPFDRLVQYVTTEGGRAEATVLVHGVRVPARNAVLVNAAMARALDFDDVHEGSIVHTGVSVVPAALAIAERQGGVDGRAFIAAIALGQDLLIRLSDACEVAPNLQGRPGTYVFGTFATAAVTSRLLGSDAPTTLDALGNAYLRATGSTLGYHDGALSQRVLQGTSASAGVLAALLAAHGVGGVTNALEGHGGYYPLYEGGRYDRRVLVDDLGARWRGTETSLKPWPVHRGLCLSIEAALQIASRRGFDAGRIERVEVRFPAAHAAGHANIGAYDPARADPRGAVEPHFSDPWGVAVALVRGDAQIADFTEAGVAAIRAEIVPVARRVVGVPDASLEPVGVGPKVVRVVLVDGTAFEARVDHGLGGPAAPMSWDDVVAKFRRCAARAARPLSGEVIDRTVDAVADLEHLEDASVLASLLAGG